MDEKTSSLINTTLETIRQEELEDFPQQNEDVGHEEQLQPAISEVTEVIDLKK